MALNGGDAVGVAQVVVTGENNLGWGLAHSAVHGAIEPGGVLDHFFVDDDLGEEGKATASELRGDAGAPHAHVFGNRDQSIIFFFGEMYGVVGDLLLEGDDFVPDVVPDGARGHPELFGKLVTFCGVGHVGSPGRGAGVSGL